MPVSVIMIGKKDGTAEPVAPPKQTNSKPDQAYPERQTDEKAETKGPILDGRQIIFVENKNTNRHLRNVHFGTEQIFVNNKDTNRETNEDLANKAMGDPCCQPPYFVSRSSPQLFNCNVPELLMSSPGNPQVITSFLCSYTSKPIQTLPSPCRRLAPKFNVLSVGNERFDLPTQIQLDKTD